ncbi:PP2C family protein-serine/threonine phosphatase [Catellatospora sp. IY07-71]|uniref:PP2C family protein-serine/threonine phosphatase n=1 Tax=Catellatospora sp. IY07-71 TaxID=2728827 RepID=UPI001BB3F0B2|nr:PP2C family protein-serine/threonine phosphatase [Catellatospora sp. IY07-71]
MQYDPWHAALLDLLHLIQRAQGDEVAASVSAALRPLGLEITCYLVDEEQSHLHPLPEPGKPAPAPLGVDGTMAGRAFTTVNTHRATTSGGTDRLWVPLIDGTERLGVADLVFRREDCDIAAVQEWCESYVNLVGHLIAVKLPYGDSLNRVRRTRRMSVAGELLLATLPPQTFTTDRLVISSILQPHYDVGGDAFDYALDDANAWFAVLDGMGRGLPASLMTVATLAALRAARRAGFGLYASAREAERTLTRQFGDKSFVTAVLCELDLESGRMRYVNAGHPFPLLLRRHQAVRELTGGRRLPLGLADGEPVLGEEVLEPGDRLLLYTDGVVEARNNAGDVFGVERLVDFTERAALAGTPAPETLRGLSHRVAAFQDGPPRDDATLMLLEWSAEAARRARL